MLAKHLYHNRIVIDVNIPAIYLVEDHPGHKYVYEYMERARRTFKIYAQSVTPYRVIWILTKRWGLPYRDVLEAVRSFIEDFDINFVGLTREWLLKSFELSYRLRHDIYDCSYIALALMVRAKTIVSTDTDFKRIAPRVGLEYVNPVPLDVLRRFKEYKVK